MNEPPGARARVALTGLAIAGKSIRSINHSIHDKCSEHSHPTLIRLTRTVSLIALLQSISVTPRARTYSSSWTTFSVSPRPVPRCQPFWAVSPLPWGTSQPSQQTWVCCRRELPPLDSDPLHPCKPCTYLPMILPTLPLPPHSHIWTPPQFFQDRLQSWAFTLPWILLTPHQECLTQGTSPPLPLVYASHLQLVRVT